MTKVLSKFFTVAALISFSSLTEAQIISLPLTGLAGQSSHPTQVEASVLSPYFIQQRDEQSCSLASSTMVLNAIRNQIRPHSHIVTQQEVLNRVNIREWKTGVDEDGNGVTLDELKIYLSQTLRAFGITNFKVEVHHVNPGSLSYDKFTQDLKRMENSRSTFIIANFQQGLILGGESVGHFSPLGDVDFASGKVLVMDPDRSLRKPYWVPLRQMTQALATIDSESGNYRGYLLITIP